MLVPMGVCYLTPKARPTATPGKGYGSVALEPIAAGEVVAAFGGRCVTRDEFDLLPASQQVRSLQIDEHLYMAGAPEPEPADFINHSCEPNCVLSGSVVLVAARDIAVGEELDLRLRDQRRQRLRRVRVRVRHALSAVARSPATTGCCPNCSCATAASFSPYLAKRIAALVSVGAERRAFAL